MNIHMKRFGSKDFYDAFALCETLFMVMAFASKIVSPSLAIPAVLLMWLGLLFAFIGYEHDHPGSITGDFNNG